MASEGEWSGFPAAKIEAESLSHHNLFNHRQDGAERHNLFNHRQDGAERHNLLFTRPSLLELHEGDGGLAVDAGFVLGPVQDPAAIRVARRRLAADDRHDGVAGRRLIVEKPGALPGEVFHFKQVQQVDENLALEEIGDFPDFLKALFEFIEGSVLVRGRDEEVEFAMTPLGFILLLLVGGMQEFPDVDHGASLLHPVDFDEIYRSGFAGICPGSETGICGLQP
jgi:hypothetical protein